jgi:hypothetical protein
MIAICGFDRVTLLPDHCFDVGAVQRCWRLETVEHDADGTAISAPADDDTFSARQIWASGGAERTHPDAREARQWRPIVGRLCMG